MNITITVEDERTGRGVLAAEVVIRIGDFEQGGSTDGEGKFFRVDDREYIGQDMVYKVEKSGFTSKEDTVKIQSNEVNLVVKLQSVQSDIPSPVSSGSSSSFLPQGKWLALIFGLIILGVGLNSFWDMRDQVEEASEATEMAEAEAEEAEKAKAAAEAEAKKAQEEAEAAKAEAEAMSEEKQSLVEVACYENVQGKIAFDHKGSKSWNPINVRRLCKGTTKPTEPGQCFAKALKLGKTDSKTKVGKLSLPSGPSSGRTLSKQILQKNSGGSGKVSASSKQNFGIMAIVGGGNWGWSDSVNLCEGTSSSSYTHSCLQRNLRRGKSKKQAIEECEVR